ncbi:diuretic hormone receptor-like isoform X1 [Penaeus indicus]|uniref:diuretic hormone receptor-like isoform X1 n=1 Tax=Penaeus indicus TaxID=29960 RepID=UPI00300D7789
MPSVASPSEGPLYLDPLDALDPLEPLVGPLDAMAEEDGERAQGSTSAEPPAPPNPELVNEVKNTLWRRYMEQSTVFNATNDDEKVLKCFNEYVNMVMEPEFGPGACPVKFDGVSCWPETPPGTLKAIPCFDDFNGVPYEPSENNATLYCYPNGTWSRISFYNDCLNVVMNNTEESVSTTVSTSQTIFYIGNSLSLVAVTLALWIFISFKDLRCLRNTIHTNLLFTYLLHNLFWIVYASVQTLVNESIGCTFFVALSYFNLTNFMWMFVEGLYLYMLVVKTFSVENIKLRVYTLIGWGIPVAIIITWVILKSNLTVAHTGPELGMENIDVEGLLRTCPLMPVSHVDWIQKVPILFFLSTNFIFLMRIMWVLITKLRSANTVETQRYRKATKALLVLIPLLGLTYMLLIALPQELEHVRAILLSTQGFWVAVFFCFLNSEVQNSIRHHIERWKTERGITDPRNPSIRLSRDGSPRPRTVCSSYGRRLFGSKRESLCSEVTTMTTYVANGYNPNNQQAGNQLQPQPQQLQPPLSPTPVTQQSGVQLQQQQQQQPLNPVNSQTGIQLQTRNLNGSHTSNSGPVGGGERGEGGGGGDKEGEGQGEKIIIKDSVL